MAVRRYFTLYFIPLIPLWSGGEYVECTACAGTFGPEALHYNPEQERQNIFADVKRVMVLAAIAEGRPTAARLDAVRQQFQRAGGPHLSDHEIAAEAQAAFSVGLNLNTFAMQKAFEWSPDFKAAVFSACVAIILADGGRLPVREQICAEFGRALGYTPQQVGSMMSQALVR
jgi:hypothetical protein